MNEKKRKTKKEIHIFSLLVFFLFFFHWLCISLLLSLSCRHSTLDCVASAHTAFCMCLIPFVCRYLKNYNCESRFSNNFELCCACGSGIDGLLFMHTQMYLWICTLPSRAWYQYTERFSIYPMFTTEQSVTISACIQTMRIHSHAEIRFEYNGEDDDKRSRGLGRERERKINIRLLCAYCPFISESSKAVDAVPHTRTPWMMRACVNIKPHKIDK